VSTASSPKTVTIWGRLSFPTWTAQEAYERSQKGQYPSKDVASTSPDFQLLLTSPQWEKFLKHATEVFIPYCVTQHAAGEKRDALDPKEAQLLIDGLTGDLAAQVYNTPAKPLSDKSAELAPECVAAVKVIGPKGGDFELKAIVNNESELAVPDPDILTFPVIMPVNRTVHQFYPGCNVAVTLSLYAYHNGKLPGFSAGGNVAVFKGDNDRFGGGTSIDVDEIFLDD
jgi:hypothetical protein